MDKKFIGIAQTVIRTTDVKKIGNLICDELNCGDVVIKVENDKKQSTYQVIYKTDTNLSFCYCDNEKAIIVKYEKVGGVWAWKSSTETSVGNPFTPSEVVDIKELINGKIKEGTYIYDNEKGYVFIDSEVPEDYTGQVIRWADDGLYFQYYRNGVQKSEGYVSNAGISCIGADSSSSYMDASGVDKVQSGEATAGQVLTADGNGGSSWETPAGGGTQWYKHTLRIKYNGTSLGQLYAYSNRGTQLNITNFALFMSPVSFSESDVFLAPSSSIALFDIGIMSSAFNYVSFSNLSSKVLEFDYITASSGKVKIGTKTFNTSTMTYSSDSNLVEVDYEITVTPL